MLAPSRTVSTITGPKEMFGTILPPIDVDPVCAGAVDSAPLLAELPENRPRGSTALR